MGSDKFGNFSFELPNGTFTVTVNVYDNEEAAYLYTIPFLVVVNSKDNILDDLNKIIIHDPRSNLVNKLFSGNSEDVLNTVRIISFILKNFKLTNSSTSKSFLNAKSILIPSDLLLRKENDNESNKGEEEEKNSERQFKTKVNDALVSSLSQISVGDFKSVSKWSNVLSSVTSTIDALSPGAAVIHFKI